MGFLCSMKKNLNENEKKKKNDRENWKKTDVYVVLKRKKKVNMNDHRQILATGLLQRVNDQLNKKKKKKEEDDWKPYIPEVPNAALFAVYTSPDTFWLSMVCLIIYFQYILNKIIQDDYDAGYLYHCQLSNKDDRFQYNPERQDAVINTLPVPNTDPAHGEDIPLTSILIRYLNTI